MDLWTKIAFYIVKNLLLLIGSLRVVQLMWQETRRDWGTFHRRKRVQLELTYAEFCLVKLRWDHLYEGWESETETIEAEMPVYEAVKRKLDEIQEDC